jgi:hypothetical protein
MQLNAFKYGEENPNDATEQRQLTPNEAKTCQTKPKGRMI